MPEGLTPSQKGVLDEERRKRENTVKEGEYKQPTDDDLTPKAPPKYVPPPPDISAPSRKKRGS